MYLLLIDDEEKPRSLLGRILELEGYSVLQASNAAQAWKTLGREDIGVVLTDLKLPDENGLDLLRRIKEKFPMTEVVMMSAYGTIADGVKAIKEGAFDYISQGDQDEQILPVVARAFEKAGMQRRIRDLEQRISGQFSLENIIGSSPLIVHARTLAQRVAKTDLPVLLLGETGTGKEVFAQAIHQASTRTGKSFVAVNCSAFAKDLLESEMFGHAAGAFTGAVKEKKGLVEEARGGTLFLDEIGEMNLDLQAKLLRFLDSGEYYRVGDSKPKTADVRVVAATNRNLEKEIAEGHFREDLFYRLSVFTIHLPALRDRKEDLQVLATHFLERAALKSKSQVRSMSIGFLEGLKHLEYKGNMPISSFWVMIFGLNVTIPAFPIADNYPPMTVAFTKAN